MEPTNELDLLIVGAGPIGIACGVEAELAGLSSVLIEKGCLTNAIYHFPAHVIFFSTPNLLEIGNIPFITAGAKPTRREILYYYRRVTEHFRLDVRLYEKVLEVRRDGESGFLIRSDKRSYRSGFIVLAIGIYDHPNTLNVPGEDLPKVSHYYKEPDPYFRQKVAVLGGQNSAAEAALELYRTGAEVTLIHRGKQLGSAVKYWIRPDIENRIREGSIRALFSTRVVKIDEKSITVQRRDGSTLTLENDFIFAMTGYHADPAFLKKTGIVLEPKTKKPVHDPETMATNVERIYIAGVAAGGKDANKIFIENGREHAKLIVKDILKKISKDTKPKTRNRIGC